MSDHVFPEPGAMSDQPRPVWLTREQRDDLDGIALVLPNVSSIVSAWDAAPADSAEAAREAIINCSSLDRPYIASAVLRALGMPDPVRVPAARDEPCPACGGSGRFVVNDPDDPETCEGCSGSGRVVAARAGDA